MGRKPLRKVNDGLYIAAYNDTQAIAVDFTRDGSKVIDAIDYTESGIKSKQLSGDYFTRSRKDDKLLRMHKLATESPNKWQLIDTKAAFIAGGGIKLYRRVIENNREVLVPDIDNQFWDDWYEKLDLDNYWEASSENCSFGAELNVKLTLGLDKKVLSLEVIDNNDIRAEKPESGNRIQNFWLSEEFGYKPKVRKEDCDIIPAFDPSDPTKYPVSIIHLIARKPGQKVYGLANWWGTEQWTNVANRVPKYYEAAFKNGFFVTHHVSFPDDYWDKEGLDEEQKKALEEETLNEISDTLQSIEEANKIVITFSRMASDGKSSLKEVKITPIENPLKDEAFLAMYESANVVQASGHGVPGRLAGVQLGRDTGSSGKEIAAEAAYAQDFLQVFDRMRIIKPIKIAAMIDGLDLTGRKIGIERIESYVPGSTSKDSKDHPNN